ncbi:MAG: hypothetical protein U0835_22195 [Isosphaeraceae bacterium]
MGIALQAVAGAAVAYLAATVSESFLHRVVGHAGPRTRRVWARHRWLFGPLLRAHYRHGVVHHRLTFRRDHVTQFTAEHERAAAEEVGRRVGDGHIVGERFGLTVGPRALMSYNLTVLPWVVAFAWLVGPWSMAGSLPVLTLAPLSAMVVHPYLHRRYDEALAEARGPLGLLVRSAYFRSLWRHHFLHHRHPAWNFNLLPGGDFLLRTRRAADESDLRAIESLGGPTPAGRRDAAITRL